MIDPREWLEAAKALPEGTKSSIVHGCGSGRKLLIEHKPEGYACWCYRCSEGGWAPKPKPSLAERLAKLKVQKAADNSVKFSPTPPQPIEFNVAKWPVDARVWLFRCGIDEFWIGHLGFYWCDRIERVVMPVLDDLGLLCYWQARGFDPKRPKYLSQALPSGVAKPVYKAIPFRRAPCKSKTLVITEDILSAIKVGEQCDAWSILGTSLTALSEAEIANSGYSKVLVWLDPDEAGVHGRRKIVPQLRRLGINAKAVRSGKDPKLYDFDEIRSFITK